MIATTEKKTRTNKKTQELEQYRKGLDLATLKRKHISNYVSFS